MLIDFIWSNIEALGEKRHLTVEHLRLPPSTVVSVPTNMRTLDAFNLMIKKVMLFPNPVWLRPSQYCRVQGVSGLPVVNEDGALVDNISIRDLRVPHLRAKLAFLSHDHAYLKTILL